MRAPAGALNFLSDGLDVAVFDENVRSVDAFARALSTVAPWTSNGGVGGTW